VPDGQVHLCWPARVVVAAFAVSAVTFLPSQDALAKDDVAPSRPGLLLMLARDPEVQANLATDRGQAEAIEKAVAAVDEPLWRLRDAPSSEGSETVRQLTDRFEADMRRILRPGQFQRLQQIVLRAQGWESLRQPAVAERIKLSQQQRGRVEEILAQNQTRDARGREASGDALQRQILTVFSEDQRRAIGLLAGNPFDFSHVRQLAVKAPELRAVEEWINSAPLSLSDLRGKVVALHFWTFGCSNCIHNYPAYKNWRLQIPSDRFVILGVHTPETAGERDVAQIRRAAEQAELTFPIAVDNHGENWTAWGNHMWPSVYLIDKEGYVRNWWYGELNWKGAGGEKFMREKIEQILAEEN
jgi:peroxiredoxin